jgi:hypothetical protein
MPTTAINRAGDRHYKTTVPLGFVEDFDLDGTRFESEVRHVDCPYTITRKM